MEAVDIRQLAEAQQPYMVALRRRFHAEPEISGQEFGTRETLIKELSGMGVPYTLLLGTGLIAKLEGRRPGPARLLRSDIDALPLEESPDNLARPKVCVSQKPGACHACGHDAHMAMLLGTLRALSDVREHLCGTVYACFEEGEETNCGLPAMMAALDGLTIDECFALHVYSGLEAGKISLSPGPRMAGAVRFDLKFRGRSGHGSRPDLAVNPIIPAAHMVGALDSLLRNRLEADAAVTLGLCRFQAGDTWNVIPETALLSGSARYFRRRDGEQVLRLLHSAADNMAALYGCTVDYEPATGVILGPVVNDPAVSGRVGDTLAAVWGQDALSDCGAWYASETFSRYLERWPGALGLLGIQNDVLGSGAPHHSDAFDIDETVLPLGVAAELAFVL